MPILSSDRSETQVYSLPLSTKSFGMTTERDRSVVPIASSTVVIPEVSFFKRAVSAHVTLAKNVARFDFDVTPPQKGQ